jgi:hypothetical protein
VTPDYPDPGMNRQQGLLCFIHGPLSIPHYRKKAGASIFAAGPPRAGSSAFPGTFAGRLCPYGTVQGFERSRHTRKHRHDGRYHDRRSHSENLVFAAWISRSRH